MSAPRPKAKWKVAYEARVAGLSNADLLQEALSNASSSGNDLAGDHDYDSDGITAAELTRRLTACGFLPPTPVKP